MNKPKLMGKLYTSGLYITEQTMKQLFGAKLGKYLKTLTSKYIANNRTIETKLYDITNINGTICYRLPRGEIQTLHKIDQFITIHLPNLYYTNFTLLNDLLPPQCVLVEELCARFYNSEQLENGTATAVINVRAGMGKTFIASGIIEKLKLRTLYIVPKVPLAKQAIDDLSMMLGGDSVGKYDPDNPTKYDITVCVINTALNIAPKVYHHYSFIIMDEVHMYCSPKRRAIFNLSNARAVLGMSATTNERLDNLDILYIKHLAPTGVYMTDNLFANMTKYNLMAKVIRYHGPPEYTQNLKHESTGKIFTHYMHNQFISDPYRLKLIINELLELYNWSDTSGNQHNIYVFAEEIKILRTIMEKTSELITTNNIDITISAPELQMFIGGTKSNDIDNIKRDARILFTTYGFGGTGISINKMSAIIFATPRKANMKQILARIMRHGSNVEIPRVVIDVVDAETALCNQYTKRKLAYEYYGFDTSKKKLTWDDINLDK